MIVRKNFTRRLFALPLALVLAVPSFLVVPATAVASDTVADNDIPSAQALALPVSGKSGSVGGSTDRRDVYKFTLAEGQKVAMRLTTSAPGSLDIDAFLYAPGALSVLDPDAPKVFTTENPFVYPESMTYVVPPGAAGEYYLELKAITGSGPYSLSAKVASATADDEIPLSVEASSPISGTLDRYGDQDDVYKVFVAEGKSIRAALSGSSTSDFDLYLFGPASTSVFSGPAPLEVSTGLTSTERLESVATTSGWHYLDVYSAYSPSSGAGSYSLSYWVGLPTALTLSGPKSVPYGGSAILNGSLTEGGSGIESATVTVQHKPLGAAGWSTVTTASVDATGTFSATVKPYRGYATQYRAVYAGVANELLPAASSAITVKPQASLSRPSVSSGIRAKRAFTVTGRLRPRYPNGAKGVRLQAQRYERGRWVTRKWGSATTYRRDTYSIYKGSMAVPYRGRWRVRAVLPTNTRNSYSVGAWRYFSAR